MNNKKLRRNEYMKQNIPLVIMALPAVVLMIAYYYVPMFGLVLGFKDFSNQKGILGSPWVGLDNFKYIFSSGDIVRTIGNTIGYQVAFTIVTTGCSILLGVMLYFVKSKRASNTFQKAIIMPFMVSFTIIAYIVYILLSNDYGLVNNVLANFGVNGISWYNEPKYWPFILVMVNTWFSAGIKSVYYYASMMAIDQALFEAADLDGAKRHHKVFKIILPSIAPTIAMLLIVDLGRLLESNLALHMSVPMDSSALYRTTDVLATFIYRGLTSGNISTSTALGLFTGVVTTVATLTVNWVIKKISYGNQMF